MFRIFDEKLLLLALKTAALISVLIVVSILAITALEAWPFLNAIGFTQLFSLGSWHPTEGQFGLGTMTVASLASAFGATCLALPAGVLCAVYCVFYAPDWVANSYKRMLGVLAGIPSVVYGLWGLTELVPLIGQYTAPGASLLASILILSLMIFPTMALTSEVAIRNVPSHHIDAGYALGMGRASIILKVALRIAQNGIGVGALLALTRALGETMAVLMVSGNITEFPQSLFDPIRTLAANIALEMAYATEIHRSALFASGMFLMMVVTILTLITLRAKGEFGRD